jgi:hypothetical protein
MLYAIHPVRHRPGDVEGQAHPLAGRTLSNASQYAQSGVSHPSSHSALLPAGNCDAAAERFIYHAEALDPPVAQP